MVTTTRLITSSKVAPLFVLNRVLKGSAFKDARYFILLDENILEHCLPRLVSQVESLQEAEFLEVPVGEEGKQIEIASQLWQALLESGADRDSVIVNLGGGSVSDLGGFVAAGFKRGIRYINVPTTLLSMADAAIGGKTAVDIGECKNQVGFFHSPVITCIDPVFLDTLPDDERLNGLFEVKKTSLLADMPFPAVKQQLSEIVVQCAQFKQSVCKADPFDRGIRKMLNFGHTFGHAFESFFRNTGHPVSHGVAVGLGMWCELYLSMKKLALPEKVFSDYGSWLCQYVQLPHFSLQDTEQILAYMRQDKKCSNGEILCVLLQEVGTPVVDVALDESEVRHTLLQMSRQ